MLFLKTNPGSMAKEVPSLLDVHKHQQNGKTARKFYF